MKNLIFNVLIILALAVFFVCNLPTAAHAATITDQPLTPCGLTARQYDEMFARLGKPRMVGFGQIFEAGEIETGVNGLVVASISCLETGWGTSYSANYRNNMGGILGPHGYRIFDSKEESIRYMFRILAGPIYIGSGRITIDEIAPAYCTTEGWAPEVHSIIQKLICKLKLGNNQPG